MAEREQTRTLSACKDTIKRAKMQINLQFSEREYLRGEASEILFFFLFHKEKRKNQSIIWKCPKNLLSLQYSMYLEYRRYNKYSISQRYSHAYRACAVRVKIPILHYINCITV